MVMMVYPMVNVTKSEKLKTSQPASTRSNRQIPTRSPNTTAISAQTLACEMRNIYHALSELPDLTPGSKVNSLLSRLVNLCITPYSREFITQFSEIEGIHELGEKLRPLCATAEGELEQFWAVRITGESKRSEATPTETHHLLTLFPYYQNYIDLSRMECFTISAFLPSSVASPQNFAFIGSGPFPLTSLCILEIYPLANILNIDCDASALQISEDLCARLEHGRRMSFVCTDVSCEDMSIQSTTWKEFDVVFLAALVGMNTRSKLAILGTLTENLKPGTLVVVRSAKGLRGVLYPILELSDELERIGLETLVEVHPWTKVVNSVIVLRVKER